MTEQFSNRTAGRIGRTGYAPKEEAAISRFRYVSMMSVSDVMGALLDPTMKSIAAGEGEGHPGKPGQPAQVMSKVLTLLNRWYGQGMEEARGSTTSRSVQQRRLPAL